MRAQQPSMRKLAPGVRFGHKSVDHTGRDTKHRRGRHIEVTEGGTPYSIRRIGREHIVIDTTTGQRVTDAGVVSRLLHTARQAIDTARRYPNTDELARSAGKFLGGTGEKTIQ